MPELPDVVVYCERLAALAGGTPLLRLRIASPWVLRSVDPAPGELEGRVLTGVRRLGKRIVLELAGGYFVVIHLMVAGRLRRRAPGAVLPRKRGLAALDFPGHTFLLTEEGTRKRASIYIVQGEDALAGHDPGGVEPFAAGPALFAAALTRERHTLKRALTDPTLISGIGGAYADEIMHRAGLSPLARTDTLEPGELDRLHAAVQEVLAEWVDRLRAEAADGFPEKVTAFHPEMAVHGRYGQPCPVCGTPVQRIVHADDETNYCPRCQTGGRVLADRALSRLLKEDWPRRIEDLEG
ncbi:MAG: formamidopyrimidine-DNA glycosylase [Actinobacteria bacterium RBG_16_70_17]|jgi:formamidopyrimidine-DNA glycosylase|nr:MAG: formamidopyrimidine-DNA glycosylase [Actinobacteria bacterium RBG_16_70_17]